MYQYLCTSSGKRNNPSLGTDSFFKSEFPIPSALVSIVLSRLTLGIIKSINTICISIYVHLFDKYFIMYVSCMSKCMHSTHMHVFIVFKCTRMYTHLDMHVYTEYVFLVSLYLCMYCMHTCMHVCLYVCMNVCT